MKTTADTSLIDAWRAAWPEALAVWSKFTRLRDPNLCASRVEASKQGLSGSFAMIRLLDQSVVVDLPLVTELGLDDYALEVLAHEIGHHILAPGSASDQFRLLARMRRVLLQGGQPVHGPVHQRPFAAPGEPAHGRYLPQA